MKQIMGSCEFHLVTLAALRYFSDSKISDEWIDFLTIAIEKIAEALLNTLLLLAACLNPSY